MRHYLPPIINKDKILPRGQRPKCRMCRKTLGANIIWQGQGAETYREFLGTYGRDGEFCTNKCAERWGSEIARELTAGRYFLVSKETLDALRGLPPKKGGS